MKKVLSPASSSPNSHNVEKNTKQHLANQSPASNLSKPIDKFANVELDENIKKRKKQSESDNDKAGAHLEEVHNSSTASAENAELPTQEKSEYIVEKIRLEESDISGAGMLPDQNLATGASTNTGNAFSSNLLSLGTLGGIGLLGGILTLRSSHSKAMSETKTSTSEVTKPTEETVHTTPTEDPKVLPKPEFIFNPITDDNIINRTELNESITLSGSVTNANANDVVSLKVGNTTLTATVQADGRFSVNTTGAVLAQGNQIEASITTRDSAGNQATATKTHSYDVVTNIAQPVITLDKVTQDNVINATEAKQASITLSGSVTNANANDVVTLKVGSTTLNATVQADGRFSVNTTGAVLAQGNQIEASITTRDSAGNQVTATKTHSYDVVTNIAQPVITLDKVTQDNVINATEAKQASITLSGSVTNANANDVVTLKVGSTTLNATVQADGRFSVNTTGAVLAQGNQIEASITTRDSAGNQVTATRTHSYDVVTNIAQPVITLDKVTQDNVINATEAKQASITLSGSVTNANANDVVTLKVGNTTLTATVQADGRFSVNTTGAVLAQGNQIEASITTRDSAGNQVTATKTHSYDVVTNIAQPVITLDKVTQDNVINATEAKQSSITLSGSVTNANANDVVTLKVGSTTLTATVQADGRFSTTTTGAVLAQGNQIEATITTRDSAGNQVTATKTHSYDVVTNIAQPVITLDKVTQDNVINATEAKQSSITLSGSVTNANANDVVTLKVGSTTLTATVQADGRFSTTTTGAVLAQGNQIEATITTRDSAGNQVTATKTHSYDVVTNIAQPVITLDKVTQDNVINATEAKQASITLSGSVTNANTNDVVSLKVGNTTLNATVQADGRFSVNTTGAVLAQGNQIEASITTRDSAGNQVTATKTHSYDVVTNIAQPVITLDKVTQDNVINATEAKQASITLSGSVTNANANDVVTLKVGNTTLTATVQADGRFSTTTTGAVLAQGNQIEASITTRNSAGNQATATKTHSYDVVTNIAQPVITLDKVTQDNVINATEAKQASITLSGSVTNANANDVVTLKVGSTTLTATVQADGRFSTTTTGAVLAQGNQIEATITTRDSAGNQVTATKTHSYDVVTNIAQPVITLDKVTQDNVINATEAKQASITLSGSVTNANTNDVVSLKVGNTTLNATVQADGRFSVNTTGAVLAQGNQIEASITTRDSAGNQVTATKTHSYDVVTNIAQPVITLDKVTQDNVINATEAKQASITLSGSVTNANANDVVTLKVGNTTLTATVQADGRFSTTTTGAVLAQGNQIEASITTRDSAGNQVTVAKTHSYDVITNLAQPVITLDKVTQDNVINATEAKQSSITLSGSVTNASTNDVVTLKVGNTTLTATVQADGRFSTSTTGAVLAQGNQIEASITTRDSAGNQVTATKTHSYDVVTNIAQPVITLDKVTQDNVINATEAKQASITLSGSVTNASANDVVSLKVGNTTLTATVQADGRFSVNTTGAVLAQGNQIEASITTRDSAGNQVTATKTHSYDVVTNIAQPVITLDKVTQDNVINATEAKQASITLSGSVTNANANDVVTLKVGSTTLTATVQADGRFSVNTTGAVLAQGNQIEASITTRDSAGNQVTATKTHSYDVVTNIAQPVITLDKVTQDNVINATEAKQASITLSGSVTNASANDVVSLKVGNTTLTATVQADGRFSVNTTGAVLAQGNQIEASITTRDSAGNQVTATKTHSYDVVTNIAQPVITLDKVTQDNVINATEAKQASITLSGSVTNANANDVVSLKVGNTTLTATVQADGRFSVNTTGAVLAQGNQIEASITTRDSAGNQVTATKTHSYSVITSIAKPVITFNDVTDHNSINLAETKSSQITVSGTVKNARDKDTITIKIGDQTLTAEVVGERFSVTTSGQILAKNSKITASLTTRDTAGNEATANASHDYTVLPIYSTKVTYPNSVKTYESNDPFDFSTLKYTLDNPQSYVLQNSTAKNKVIAALEQYVQANPTLAAQNIIASYKADSDGDGIIDIYDKAPQMWNVSERDLRFFAAAAHSSENVNRNIFERYNEDRINDFNTQRLNNGADIRDINKHWDVLKFVAGGDGLEYFIYGNGKQADGSYQNVVISFRGTNSPTDWSGNISILSGEKHPQLKYIEQAAEYVAAYNPHNLYATGTSLGGYLAQYFASYTAQNNAKLSEAFHHSSLFNPAILKTDSGSPNDLKQARANTNIFVKQSITDDSDMSQPVELNTTNSYVIRGEWLSDGYLIFSGLGSYENTTFFDGTGNSRDKHNMSQFFANNAKLEETFSRGYLMDNHYLSKDNDNDGLTNQQEERLGTDRSKVDSDGDGFSDKLEAQLKSDPLNGNTIPEFLDKINIQEVFSSIAVTIEGQNSQGGAKSKEVQLTASLEGNNIVYSLDPIVAAEHTADFVL